MSPVSLVRAVTRATGETCREIRHRGFGLADPLDVDFDPEPNERLPETVDWDELESDRLGLFP
jgi:hypothetical protein